MVKTCEVCEFLTKDGYLLETDFWQVRLGSDQSYLGRSYVNLKRHCGNLSSLTKEEWDELFYIITKMEDALRKTFNADLFNWTCLMNKAFQDKPYNPHIHWHFRPRYSQQVIFKGMSFTDPEFGYHYAQEKVRLNIVTKNLQKDINEEILQNLK